MDLAPVSAESPPFKNLQKFSDNGRIWRFLEIEVPLVIIHFHGIFHERFTIQRFWGTPMTWETFIWMDGVNIPRLSRTPKAPVVVFSAWISMGTRALCQSLQTTMQSLP